MIWNGNIQDTTNFISEKYLQINSCGIQNTSADYTVVRENGRVDYHILLIASGTCTAFHNEKTYTLTSGDALIYFPNEPQMYSFTEESKSLWCHFSGTAVGEIFKSAELSGGVYHMNQNTAIFKSYYSMIQCFHLPQKEKFAIPFLIEMIYNIQDGVCFSERSAVCDSISRVLLYIHTNYNKTLSLDELSKMAGYSKSRFSHLFAQETKTTPKSYQNEIRLNVSCEMLSSTDKSISEIALSCGFDDPLYYSRIFKRKYNVSPSKYRHQSVHNTTHSSGPSAL